MWCTSWITLVTVNYGDPTYSDDMLKAKYFCCLFLMQALQARISPFHSS
jgi:hypothetical protein